MVTPKQNVHTTINMQAELVILLFSYSIGKLQKLIDAPLSI